MDKIVKEPIKIDLHIHSVISTHKDKEKVKNNTEENISTLVTKLIENGINMCSITDHDKFSYSMYKALKNNEGDVLKKVLPGVEFSVKFDDKKVIHVITIFNDKDEEKVKKIEQVLESGIGKEKYKDGSYSQEDYISILKEIGLDFVMIAHQKKTLTSQQKPHKSDVLSLGREKFDDLLFLEYFDAYEFRRKDNEVFNKKYIIDNNVKDKLRFITGSDCHNWFYYPNSKEIDEEISFTYLKALPTFKGLVMAITDYHRINYSGSFWGQGKSLKEIKISIEGKTSVIPLSKGINVIIGDNSIGKSLLLHELTDEREIINNSKLKKGYSNYLKKKQVEIKSKIKESEIFKFNSQGQIREIFEDENLKADKYLAEFFPNEIDSEKYRKIVEREFENIYRLIDSKYKYEDKINQLLSFEIDNNEVLDHELILGIELEIEDNSALQELIENIQMIIEKIKTELLVNELLNKNERKHLKHEVEYLELLYKKYNYKFEKTKKERIKKNAFNTALKKYKNIYSERQTDKQNKYNSYIENKNYLINNIVDLVKEKNNLKKYECNINAINVKPEINPVDDFVFVSKIGVERIDKEYINSVLKGVFKGKNVVDINGVTKDKLKEMISRYPSDVEDPLDALKQKIDAILDRDFKPRKAIIENGRDVYCDLSAGFNSRIYFRLLSGEEKNKGIYIIDQPEDHISQKAIKDEVLEQFRNMARRRQIIMVTHNPQFIVNLDVDNVIYLSKKENEGICVQSGALEYEGDYNILKIVADNIDGGIYTIQQRVKRYEKNI